MSSVPEVGLLPDQAPDALHDEAFVVDQVKVVALPMRTDRGSADIVTLAAGVGGGVGSEEPPPPPPPHETKKIKLKKLIIKLSFDFMYKKESQNNYTVIENY
jgi:hypothetical protein